VFLYFLLDQLYQLWSISMVTQTGIQYAPTRNL
jgi:hypothetical protein